MWKATVLTLFPEMFPGPLDHSLAGTALRKKIWSLNTIDIRDFSETKYKNVDDTPYGGGAGMVMCPDVLGRALDYACQDVDTSRPLIYMSPRGKRLSQSRVKTIASGTGAVILCGRYEGIDQRIIDYYNLEETSVGDYILSGGEVAAYSLLDACIRLLPNVMGNKSTLSEESFENDLLEYPHYTRPDLWKGLQVPDILKSGHHEEIKNWRHKKAEQITKERRPDLWEKYHKTLHSKKG